MRARLAVIVLSLFALFAASGCAHRPAPSLDGQAVSYVTLTLALGEHDADWVDAYYGPAEWREAVKKDKKSLEAIHSQASALLADVESFAVPRDEMLALRRNYLIEQLGALITKTEMLQGKKFTFEEEARRLYGVRPEPRTDAFFEEAIAGLEKELAGSGSLASRVEAYRSRFYIPADRIDRVMRAALDECRARTLQHMELPAGEKFNLEYVKDKPWSGYNWYQGNYTSLIQINTGLPMGIERALDLACHEGYPGHHTYNVLLEKNLVRDRGWVEYSVYPLNSPQSLIAEGSGNYGLVMAFPGEERMRFHRDVLFPLAGFDPAEAARYERFLQLTSRLSYTRSEMPRRYLDGQLTREQASAWLIRHALATPERAEQSLKFAERYRSYVINYTLGQDLVRGHIEKHSDRWAAFRELLSKPILPSRLRR